MKPVYETLALPEKNFYSALGDLVVKDMAAGLAFLRERIEKGKSGRAKLYDDLYFSYASLYSSFDKKLAADAIAEGLSVFPQSQPLAILWVQILWCWTKHEPALSAHLKLALEALEPRYMGEHERIYFKGFYDELMAKHNLGELSLAQVAEAAARKNEAIMGTAFPEGIGSGWVLDLRKRKKERPALTES